MRIARKPSFANLAENLFVARAARPCLSVRTKTKGEPPMPLQFKPGAFKLNIDRPGNIPAGRNHFVASTGTITGRVVNEATVS